MKERLEDVVKRNREAFDDRNPSLDVWAGIEGALPPRKPRWREPLQLWRAAAILFMGLSIYLVLSRDMKDENLQAENTSALQEFRSIETFYVEQINQKVELINRFNETDGLDDLTQDFKQLEAMYMVLREEMKSDPSNKVKDALILNLLVRINLLNQQIHKLESEYDKQEPEDSSV